MQTRNIEKVLDAFAKKVVQRAVNNLAKQDGVDTGTLARKLTYDVNVYPSGALELDFTGPYYWKFVDKGVKGSKSGRKAYKSPFRYKGKNIKKGVIEAWVKRKGIQGRDKKGRFIKHKTLSYLIGRSIALYGRRATRFFSNAFRYETKQLPPEIRKAYAKDISAFMKFALKDYQ